MKQNVGKVDRVIRILIALVLVVVGFLTGLWWLYIIALIPFIEGIFGYCPLYALLKINTNKIKKKKK